MDCILKVYNYNNTMITTRPKVTAVYLKFALYQLLI